MDGQVKVNVLPLPTSLSTQIFPPAFADRVTRSLIRQR